MFSSMAVSDSLLAHLTRWLKQRIYFMPKQTFGFMCVRVNFFGTLCTGNLFSVHVFISWGWGGLSAKTSGNHETLEA